MRTLKIPDDVLGVLSRSRVDGHNLYLPGALPRTLYVQTDKVIKALGGAWKKRGTPGVDPHVFPDPVAERLDNLLLTGEYAPPRLNGYVPTPRAPGERLIGYADLEDGMLVLEPSAGEGHLADLIMELHPHTELFCCEIDPGRREKLIAKGHRVIAEDCLSLRGMKFDAVVMNPPFERQQDIVHVTHCFTELTAISGGRLAAIMSAGVLFRQDRRTVEFRSDILDQFGSIEEELPHGAFKLSGTDVRTVIEVLHSA